MNVRALRHWLTPSDCPKVGAPVCAALNVAMVATQQICNFASAHGQGVVMEYS